MFSSAIKINLLMPSDVRLPSADDWGSCGQHAALCSLGILCHNILGYCFEVGCPSWSELGSIEIEGQDEVAEIRRKIQKKAYRSNCVLTDNAQRRKILLLTWIGAPLESLISELQYLDANGRGLLDIQWPNDPLNPFRRCRRRIASLLRSGRDGDLGLLSLNIPYLINRILSTIFSVSY